MPEVKLIKRYIETENCRKLKVFEEAGGYGSLRKMIDEGWDADHVMAILKSSNLRGLGGAGFPTGMKWGFVPKDHKGPRYLVVNADESEPGTFKDRHIIAGAPHLMLEGALIGALCIGAEDIYIYIRGEYYEQARIMEEAIEEAREAGYIGDKVMGSGRKVHVHLHRGAGAYICGEETALLSSLEGGKGWPKLKPPFPAVKGLFGQPTIVNNVETLSYVPIILEKGAEYFAGLGIERNGGTRLFGVSGHVKQTGIYELPLGTPMRHLIYDLCGGIREDRRLKAVIPGGSSCPVLTPEEAESINLDFDSLARIGSMLGSGGLIVMDETTDLVQILWRICKFYSFESCGQCTPCREGTGWMTRIMERVANGEGTDNDIDNLLEVASMIQGNTICPLGDAAALPVISFLSKFREEFEETIFKGRVHAGAAIGDSAAEDS